MKTHSGVERRILFCVFFEISKVQGCSMSDFPAPSGAETSNPAFANAVQRAKEVNILLNLRNFILSSNFLDFHETLNKCLLGLPCGF